MILKVLEYGTLALMAGTTGVVSYGLYLTARYPTAWCNRIKAPKVAAEDFKVYGHDSGLI
jgi:hypothetical protein